MALDKEAFMAAGKVRIEVRRIESLDAEIHFRVLGIEDAIEVSEKFQAEDRTNAETIRVMRRVVALTVCDADGVCFVADPSDPHELMGFDGDTLQEMVVAVFDVAGLSAGDDEGKAN